LTWPTALPVAALRVLRTAVGRRVLQLALLVAGLFALGFLCGEQAHAAEGASTPTAVTARVGSLTSASAAAAASTPAHASTSTPAPAPAPVVVPDSDSDSVSVSATGIADPVRPVADKVAEPVGEAVAAVSEDQGRASAQVPPVSSLPTIGSLPLVSDLPGLPGLPGVSELPSLPALPGLPSLPARTLPAPVPQGSVASPSPDAHAPGDQQTAEGTVSYGPVGSVTTVTGGSNGVAHRVAPARTGHGPAPVQHGPAGDRDGVLGDGTALDGGASRHGDAHAVTPYQRVPLRLVPGSAMRSDAAETRDRYRDIPVFPG
jgi:hypothetical protein